MESTRAPVVDARKEKERKQTETKRKSEMSKPTIAAASQPARRVFVPPPSATRDRRPSSSSAAPPPSQSQSITITPTWTNALFAPWSAKTTPILSPMEMGSNHTVQGVARRTGSTSHLPPTHTTPPSFTRSTAFKPVAATLTPAHPTQQPPPPPPPPSSSDRSPLSSFSNTNLLSTLATPPAKTRTRRLLILGDEQLLFTKWLLQHFNPMNSSSLPSGSSPAQSATWLDPAAMARILPQLPLNSIDEVHVATSLQPELITDATIHQLHGSRPPDRQPFKIHYAVKDLDTLAKEYPIRKMSEPPQFDIILLCVSPTIPAKPHVYGKPPPAPFTHKVYTTDFSQAIVDKYKLKSWLKDEIMHKLGYLLNKAPASSSLQESNWIQPQLKLLIAANDMHDVNQHIIRYVAPGCDLRLPNTQSVTQVSSGPLLLALAPPGERPPADVELFTFERGAQSTYSTSSYASNAATVLSPTAGMRVPSPSLSMTATPSPAAAAASRTFVSPTLSSRPTYPSPAAIVTGAPEAVDDPQYDRSRFFSPLPAHPHTESMQPLSAMVASSSSSAYQAAAIAPSPPLSPVSFDAATVASTGSGPGSGDKFGGLADMGSSSMGSILAVPHQPTTLDIWRAEENKKKNAQIEQLMHATLMLCLGDSFYTVESESADLTPTDSALASSAADDDLLVSSSMLVGRVCGETVVEKCETELRPQLEQQSLTRYWRRWMEGSTDVNQQSPWYTPDAPSIMCGSCVHPLCDERKGHRERMHVSPKPSGTHAHSVMQQLIPFKESENLLIQKKYVDECVILPQAALPPSATSSMLSVSTCTAHVSLPLPSWLPSELAKIHPPPPSSTRYTPTNNKSAQLRSPSRRPIVKAQDAAAQRQRELARAAGMMPSAPSMPSARQPTFTFTRPPPPAPPMPIVAHQPPHAPSPRSSAPPSEHPSARPLAPPSSVPPSAAPSPRSSGFVHPDRLGMVSSHAPGPTPSSMHERHAHAHHHRRMPEAGSDSRHQRPSDRSRDRHGSRERSSERNVRYQEREREYERERARGYAPHRSSHPHDSDRDRDHSRRPDDHDFQRWTPSSGHRY